MNKLLAILLLTSFFTQGAIGMMGAFGASFASAFISKSTGGVVKSQNVNVLRSWLHKN